jgi:ATP-binding cassette, subfamily B (MDR/TAP), member 1
MLEMLLLGLVLLAGGWATYACWMIAAERQGMACRRHYLRALLRQEIGWYDTVKQSQIATRFAADCLAFQSSLGEKMATAIMTASQFVSGVVIGLIYGWMMTLVMLIILPTIVFGGYFYVDAAEKKQIQ